MLLIEAKRADDRNFARMIFGAQGVDIDAGSDSGSKTIDDVARKVHGDTGQDIVELQGAAAAREGFGVGMGLDYEILDE